MADAQSAEVVWEMVQSGDHGWVLSRSMAILSMQGGFALLEAGSVRPANRANIMMKNICDMTVGLVAWGIIGYTLAFSEGGSFGGSLDHAFLIDCESLYAHFLMQFAFAATTGTIVSGACAERIKFTTYIVLSTIVSSLVYPFVAHWAWASKGWLVGLGFYDFAGSGVVHLTGGTASVVATVVLGVRTGRFGEIPRWRSELVWRMRQAIGRTLPLGRLGRPGRALAHRWAIEKTEGHATRNLRRMRIARAAYAARFQLNDSVSIIYGTFVLSIGWLSFNMSSGLGLSGGRHEHIGRVAVVTLFGAAFGGIAGMIVSAGFKRGMTTIEDASVGVLAGLVSITASCAHIHPWEAGAVGFVGGVLACSSSRALEWAVIDDPVGAIPVHFVGGLWGLIAMGLFSRGPEFGPSSARAGLLHGGGGELLGAQVLGAAALMAWAAAGTMVALLAIGMTLGLRVSSEDEERGLDKSEHGVGAASVRLDRAKSKRSLPTASSARLSRRLSSSFSKSKRTLSQEEWRREEYIVDVAHLGLATGAAHRAALKLQRNWRERRQARDGEASPSEPTNPASPSEPTNPASSSEPASAEVLAMGVSMGIKI
eukprot:Transcript_2629.p1 GENE.Transcript_2629~~Transcript_2629.p1  ORF type:complete len:596 (-),score=160.71 Transcript_2629:2499-4286(-)